MERNARPPATTVSTIAVRSGTTRIVIALLQCRDVLELKVLELCPELTLLGETLDEASGLLAEHERVLEKIQEKQSPVNELLKKADHLIATQNTQPEVYAAMADSLGLAWKDVNDVLQKRSYLLHLNVEYHRQANVCMDRIGTLEMLCHSYLPTDVESIKNHLEHIQEVRKSILEALMVALGNGTQLLDVLKDLQTQGTLDSRPGHNQNSISLAVSQVEHWLEKLHDKRHSLDVDCHERKTMLERRLTISLLVTDLNLLENILDERRSTLDRIKNRLGDSRYECSKLTEQSANLVTEAKDIRDQALRVVKATEQLVLTKGYMEDDYKLKAYKLLEMATEYLEDLTRREHYLDAAYKFFESAEKVLRAWETILQHSSDENLASKNTHVSETVKRTGASVIQEGNSILRDVPEAEGVKRAVEELERKKQLILSIVMKDHDKYVESSEAITTFSENYNKIFSWLVSTAEPFLHDYSSMGTNLAEARAFLEAHKNLQRDLRTRGIDINALVNSTNLPPLTYVDSETRVDLEAKSVALKDHWTYLDRTLDRRIGLAELYVKFYASYDDLNAELSNMDAAIDAGGRAVADGCWANVSQLYVQLQNTGEKYLHQSEKTEDAHLELEASRERVRTVLDTAADRKTGTASVWETWQRASAENCRSDNVLWTETMCESSKTVDWVSKLESQLYPVLKSDPSSIDRHISEVKQKLNNVLPEVQRAQNDIESRIKTAEELIGKGNIHGDNISIPPRLKELHNRLVVITTEYQNLLDMFMSFFNSLQEFHDIVKDSERTRPLEILNLSLHEVEELLQKHNQSRQSVLDSFKLVYAENIRLMDKIKQQEPQKSGEQDMYVVRYLMENERNRWDQSCETYCQKIEQQQQLSQFDNDLIQINNNLNDLSQQLASTRGQYGANLASAKSASLAFHYFEKTILLLEQRIETFINAANSLMNFDHTKSDHIRDELNKLKSRWDTFQTQVLESRNHIDLCVQYFTLINEAQEWFHEGSKLLMNIARKSTEVQTSEEATALLREIEVFLKPGDVKQEERLTEIHELSVRLFGEQAIAEVPQVVTENKELLDSFSLITKELKSFDDKLKSREQQHEAVRHDEVNQIITNTYHEIMTSTSSNSVVNDVQLNGEDVQSSKKIRLDEIIKPKPTIITPLQDNTVDEGKQFQFECSVEGEPTQVTWFKDNISIDNNPDYQTSKIDNRYVLTIEETFVEDSAVFTCRAENDAGFSETSAYLSVKECQPEHQISPSVFTKLLSDLTVKEGEAYSLSCKAEGNPLPTAQWFRDENCIDNNPQYQITYNNGDALLKVERADATHGGKYSCVATNRLGSDSTASRVFVEALELPKSGPKFVAPLSNVMARAGQKLKLECEVETTESPTLIWSHNGKIMKEIKDFEVPDNRGKINLIIPEAYPKDAGTYSLTIKTVHGEASSSCQVSVKGILPNETSDSEMASDQEPIKPSIPFPLKDQTVAEGSSVHLNCVIVGQPEPEVIWYHDGRPVKESKDIQLLFQGDQCSLVIKEAFVEDAGEYRVVAINSAGEASSKSSLHVEAKPAPDIDELVVSPKFTKLLSDVLVREGDSITLECNAEGCPKPDFKWIRNTVEIKPDQRITISSDEDGTAVLHIHNALPVDKGQYTVRAVNKAGEAKCFSHVIVKAIMTFDAAAKQSTDEVHFEEKLEKPTFVETFPPVVDAFGGGSVKFECIVVGKPSPKIRWLFNEKPVSGKSFLVSTSGDRQVLTIPEVDATEHRGTVECVAENDAGKCSCSSSLKIKESEVQPAPSSTSLVMAASRNNNTNGTADSKHAVSEFYESSSRFESKQSTFMTSSSSSAINGGEIVSTGPAAFKVDAFSLQSEKQSKRIGDNAPVQSESLRTEEYHNTDGQESRHVTDVSSSNAVAAAAALEDRQTSFFERQSAASTASTATATATGLIRDDSQQSMHAAVERNVAARQARRPTAPRFVSAPQGKIAEQGEDAYLDAIVDSHPLSEIEWTKNGVPLVSDGRKIRIEGGPNKSRLDIARLSVDDSGQYTCRASNAAGATSCTTDVIVKKNVFPPVMCRRLLPNTVAEGERVVLEIEVAGTPEPTVSWFKNNQPLKFPSSAYRLRQQGTCSAIIIEKATAEHAGEYKVSAKNEGGEAVSCADLRVVQPLPDFGLNVAPAYVSANDYAADKVNVDYYKSIVPRNPTNNLQSNVTSSSSKIEEKSHFSKSVFVKESVNSQKDVTMTVNRGVEAANEFRLNAAADATDNVASYDTSERQIAVENNENVENASITKKSALQFFKNVIEDNQKVEKASSSSPPPLKTTDFADRFAQHDNASKDFSSVRRSYSSSVQEENVSTRSSSTFGQFTTGDHPTGTELVLEPGPPPTFDYMPRQAQPPAARKEQMTERLKKLSTSQKSLSPDQIPSGAVRIFPDVTKHEVTSSSQVEQTSSSSVKSEVIYSSRPQSQPQPLQFERPVYHDQAEPHGPLLRPRADIEVRPGSPRPSAEAISMEKLWTKGHHGTTVQQQHKTPNPGVQTKSYESSESQSFVSETVQRNGELVKDESREERQGTVKIDDGVSKVSKSFGEVSVRGPGLTKHVEAPATKHVEAPRTTEVNRGRSASANVFANNSSYPAEPPLTSNVLVNAERNGFLQSSSVAKMTSKTSSSETTESSSRQSYFEKPATVVRQTPSPFSQERMTFGAVKHVEPPKTAGRSVASGYVRSQSEEATTREVHHQQQQQQWKPQSPVVFKSVVQPQQSAPKTYSSYESHSTFAKSMEKDGVLVASERQEEGGRVVDDNGRRVYDSFSERTKLPGTQQVANSSASSKSNSIKTMQKMFEQQTSATASLGLASIASTAAVAAPHAARPYSRMKSRGAASDSDFESEAELSRYNVQEQKLSEMTSFTSSSFESKTYSSSSKLHEVKNAGTSSMILQSPIKESGYAADTDEPTRGGGSYHAGDATSSGVNTGHQTFNSKRNPGFQSSLIKKAEFFENERRQHHRGAPTAGTGPQWAANSNDLQRGLRSPLKFVKGEFRESDYESDYECRIQPIWRPHDSESAGPVYKPVRPSFKTPAAVRPQQQQQPHQQQQQPYQQQPQLQHQQQHYQQHYHQQQHHQQQHQHYQPQAQRYQPATPSPVQPAFDLKPGSPPQMGYAGPTEGHRSVSFVESSDRNSSSSSATETAVRRTTHFLSSSTTTSCNGNSNGVTAVADGYGTLERKAEAKRLQRVDEMRKRFEQKSLVPSEADEATAVTSPPAAFTSQFITQGANNQIDSPRTGIPYFKHDFGYEFGVAYPATVQTRDGKPANDPPTGSVSIPVKHEFTETVRYQQTRDAKSELNARPGGFYAVGGTADGAVTSPIYQKELNAFDYSADPSHSSPIFVTPLRDIAVVSGKTARFECIVQGEPISEITWSCNGQVLDNSECYQAQYRNGVCRLTIPRTYKFNAGSYMCTVSNYLGSSSTSANLQVSGESRTFIQH